MAAAVVEPVPASTCESQREQIVPTSTTACTGPWSECQQIQQGWQERGTTTLTAQTTVFTPNVAIAMLMCQAFADPILQTQESNHHKYERTKISLVPSMVTNTLFTCKLVYSEHHTEFVSTCTKWSLPVGFNDQGFASVGQKACTTCDQYSSLDNPSLRAECLKNELHQALPRSVSERRPYMIAGLKYLYMQTGSVLYANPFFTSDPKILPACVAAPPVTATCTTAIDRKLQICAVLADDFARSARQSTSKVNGWGFTECNALFDLLKQQPAGSCDATRRAAMTLFAKLQGDIDRDFAAGLWPSDGGLEPPPVEVMARRLVHFRELERGVTGLLAADELDEYLKPIFAGVLDYVHTKAKPPLTPPQPNQLAEYLNGLHLRELKGADDMLAAIYPTTPTGSAPNLGAWGQVNAVPEAIAPLAERLEDFLSIHDFRCALGVCPETESQLDREIAVIAVPGSNTPLFQVAVNPTNPIAELDRSLINQWASLLFRHFGGTSPHKDALPNAIAALLPAGAPPLAELSADAVPPSLVRLYAMISRADLRHSLYADTGRFVAPLGKKIHRLTNLANRQAMQLHIEGLAERSVSDASNFNNEFVSTMNGIIAGNSTDAQLEGLRADYGANMGRLNDLKSQKAGHQHALGENTSLDERVRAMTTEVASDFQGELSQQFVARSDARAKTIDATAATFQGADTDIASYAIHTSPVLQQHQLYQLRVTGTWSPTCALRKFNKDLFAARDTGSWWDRALDWGASFLRDVVRSPLGGGLIGELLRADKVELELDNAETGPEGFTVVQSEGKYSVESSKIDLTPSAYGLSEGMSEDYGTSTRIDASFNSGLRLPDDLVHLPVNAAPVGALLAVEMPEGATKIGEAAAIYVVQSFSATIPVTKAGSRIVLVANDNCHIEGESPPPINTNVHLTMDSFVLTGGDHLLQAFIEAVGEVTKNFRTVQTPLYLAQGELLSTDTGVLQQEAFLLFKQAINHKAPEMAQTPFDELPTAFQRLYSLFIEREINRIERIVRIEQIDREINVLDISLAGFGRQVAALADASMVSRRLKEWNVSRLDTLAARADIDTAREYLRSYMLPVFELWYPSSIAQLATDPDVIALGSLTPFTSALQHSQLMSAALRAVALRYKDASDFRYNHFTGPMMVVLSIPDPTPCPPASGGPPTGPPTTPGTPVCSQPTLATGMLVPSEIAEGFWAALRAGLAGDAEHAKYTLQLDPSMIYGDTVDPFHLVCEASLPVISRIAFMPINSLVIGNPAPNTYTWPIHFGETQTYVSAEGSQEFSLLDELGQPADRALVTNLIFAAPGDFVQRFQNASHPSAASGISPFTSYELDFSKFGSQLKATLASSKQFLLVFEVEAVSGARAGVPVCKLAP